MIDADQFPYTRAIISESMRLYPPAWVIGREVVEEHEVQGYRLPPGSVVLVSQWVVHRDPRWWPRAFEFDPDRWLISQNRPRFAYFPFGSGPRSCVGEPFAWLEAILLLATIARDWNLRATDTAPIKLHPTITLRARGAVS